MPPEIAAFEGVSKTFVTRESLFRSRKIQAVEGVSLALRRGRTLAVVGESGSGKTTLARLLMRLHEPTSGSIRILHDGRLKEITAIPQREYYRRVQMVFQDPYSSMNPRKRVWQAITRPLTNLGVCGTGVNLRMIAEREMEAVGLGSQYLEAFPHELSGGQRQRVAIARAIATQPEILVLDEPLSALDVSVQAQVLNLLMELQQRRTLTFLFITHDLAVVRHFADDVAVICAGRLIEYGPTETVMEAPIHRYTQSLVANIPGRSSRKPARAESAAQGLKAIPLAVVQAARRAGEPPT